MNKGSVSTGVSWNGYSVVGITWAYSDAFRRISGWRVAEGVQTLSDHLYIFMGVKGTLGSGTMAAVDGSSPPRRERARSPSRWKTKERS